MRTQYSVDQEPELMIQKGVGPMAVALFHGGEVLPATGPGAERGIDILTPAHKAVREFTREESEQLYRQVLRGGKAQTERER